VINSEIAHKRAGYLTPGGLDVARLAGDLMDSPEYNQYYGAPTNADLVELAYQNAFMRPPSASELNSWLARLASSSQHKMAVEVHYRVRCGDRCILLAAVWISGTIE
jgi:hypothetical protein